MQQLEELLTDFNNQYSSSIEEVAIYGQRMKAACEIIRNSWSGSFFGYHSKLYYGDFEKPPRGKGFSIEWGNIYGLSEEWSERTPDEVKTKIAQIVGNNFTVDKFEKDIEKLASEIEDFQTQTDLLVSSILDSNSHHPLAGFEKVEARNTRTAYIQSCMPQNLMTRDSEAYAQGIMTPAIIYYMAEAYEATYVVGNIQKFLKAIRNFIKWYELPSVTLARSYLESRKDPQDTVLAKIELIAHRFHIIARQLRHRHADRPTLIIENEYDMQDLFHALLHLFFDDIRSEQWTPSYAGGSSRIDFLLKAEQVVIELKMTRAGLKAKEVSDQLIIDTDRYRTHPDCKMLVAFVYDPQEYIENPRGIEHDLTKTTNGIPAKVLINSH